MSPFQTCIVCVVKCEGQEQKQVARACHIPRKEIYAGIWLRIFIQQRNS